MLKAMRARSGFRTTFAMSGLWTTQVWAQLIVFGNVEVDSSWVSVDLSLGLTLLLVCGALKSLGRTLPPLRMAKFDYGAFGLLAIASVLMAVGRLVPAAAAAPVLGIVLGGAGLAWAYLRWAIVYLRLDVRHSFKNMFLAFLIASGLRTILVFLPFLARMAVAVGVALLMFALVEAADNEEAPGISEDTAYRIERPRAVMSFALLALLFSGVCSFVRVHLRTGPFPFDVGAAPVVAASLIEAALFGVLYFLVFHRGKSLGFMQLWGIVTVFLATAILCTASQLPAGIAYALTGVASDLIVAFLWLGLLDIARHAMWDPLLAFSLGWGLYAVSKLLGKMLAHLFGIYGGAADIAAPLLWVLIVATLGCMGPRGSLLHRVFSEMNASGIEPADYRLIDERCEHIARVHALTERETRVMQYLCRGKSKAVIARELGISENTVRGHAKRLYTKLDIHNRDELYRLIDL